MKMRTPTEKMQNEKGEVQKQSRRIPNIFQAEKKLANEPGIEKLAVYEKHHKNVATLNKLKKNDVLRRNQSIEFRHYWKIREDEIYFNCLIGLEAL